MEKETICKALEEDGIKKGLSKEEISGVIEVVNGIWEAISSSDISLVEKTINEIASNEQNDIFSEVGKITRRLHNTYSDFKQEMDKRIQSLANADVHDAADKLNWVLDKTAEAASMTIDFADRGQSLHPKLIRNIDILENIVTLIKNKEGMKSTAYLKNAINITNDGFMEIMMAQEYQDLTGQILKKVINLIHELEKELIGLIKMFGDRLEPTAQKKDLSGPAIKKTIEVAAGQDDVDDLLAEYGF